MIFDISALFWLCLKYLFYFVSIVILISSIDDLFVDIWYWARCGYRKFIVRRKHPAPLAFVLPFSLESG